MGLSFCKTHQRLMLLLSGLIVFWSSAGICADSQFQGKPGVFFSQGQAIYSAQDRSKSKQQAVESFLAQAVSQAIATFLSPSQMGSQFPVIREKILSQSKHYVQDYKVFSEGPETGGIYRITGQVSVAMESLEGDLVRTGLLQPRGGQASGALPSATAAKSAPGKAEVLDADKLKENARDRSGSRGGILWAVLENWDQQWLVPQGSAHSGPAFASNVLEESRSLGWSIQFLQPGSVSIDQNGNVPDELIIDQARRLGLSEAICGAVATRPSGQNGLLIEATLRVLNVSSGRSQGEIHKQWAKEDASPQEGAMELASMVVPQLDRLLRQPSSPPQAQRSETVGPNPGEWLLRLHSDRPYADWEELEKNLRGRFKSMQVKGLEFGTDGGLVRLEGVDPSYLLTLKGTKLSDHIQIQVNEDSSDSHSLTVNFVHTETPQPDVKQ